MTAVQDQSTDGSAPRKGGRRRAEDKPRPDKAAKAPKGPKAAKEPRAAKAAKPAKSDAYVAPPPKVNLLPAKHLKAVEKRTKVGQLGATVAATVVAVAALYLAQSGQISAAKSALSDAQDHLTVLTTKANDPKLVAASDFESQVKQMESTAKSAMGNEILYSKLLAALDKDTPSGVRFSSVAISTTGSSATGSTSTTPGSAAPGNCPGPDPFSTKPSVGCVTFSGSAASTTSVNELLRKLTADATVFVNPFVTSTSNDSGKSSFNGSVNLAPNVLSQRYSTGAIFGDKAADPSNPSGGSTAAPGQSGATGGTAPVGGKTAPGSDVSAAQAITKAQDAAPESSSLFSPLYIGLFALLLAALAGLLVLRKKDKEKAS